MKTKIINGIKYNIYTDKKIEGDFIKENERYKSYEQVEQTNETKRDKKTNQINK